MPPPLSAVYLVMGIVASVFLVETPSISQNTSSIERTKCSNLIVYARSSHRIDMLGRGFSFLVPDGWDVLQLAADDDEVIKGTTNTILAITPLVNIRSAKCYQAFQRLGLDWPPPGENRGEGYPSIYITRNSQDMSKFKLVRSLSTQSGVYDIYEYMPGMTYYQTRFRSSSGVTSYITTELPDSIFEDFLRSIVAR